MAANKYATQKGAQLTELGISVKKLSRKVDGVYYLGKRVGLIEKNKEGETTTFNDPVYTRVKHFNTMIGIILENHGYAVKPRSFCHDTIYIGDEHVATTTRSGESERIEFIESERVTKLRKLSDVLN